MGVNSLPKISTRQRRGCDVNPGPSAPESTTLTVCQESGSAPEPYARQSSTGYGYCFTFLPQNYRDTPVTASRWHLGRPASYDWPTALTRRPPREDRGPGGPRTLSSTGESTGSPATHDAQLSTIHTVTVAQFRCRLAFGRHLVGKTRINVYHSGTTEILSVSMLVILRTFS